ncbi:hypothetical protein [Spongiactinospora sp. TRM90649]|uniref:hypothetical protein n=1 Tax=Spongiactinospora sp. TRM90649 TaxID=3031114 RepID=UPI0023F61A35|nr:hypothetical protein [Spongiactinospora sp. TRM90649]MDF5753616.1 hypothetical protein [Spongiactinospora sp. TRM90649]
MIASLRRASRASSSGRGGRSLFWRLRARALAAADGHDWQTIEKTAEAKRDARGAFLDRLYLE